MKRLVDRIIDRQLKAILPGNTDWPPYSRESTALFWSNWRACAPLSTRLALVGGSVLVFFYCILLRISRRGYNTLEKQLEAGLNSNNYLINQSVVLLKITASLAYFVDPKLQQKARTHKELS